MSDASRYQPGSDTFAACKTCLVCMKWQGGLHVALHVAFCVVHLPLYNPRLDGAPGWGHRYTAQYSHTHSAGEHWDCRKALYSSSLTVCTCLCGAGCCSRCTPAPSACTCHPAVRCCPMTASLAAPVPLARRAGWGGAGMLAAAPASRPSWCSTTRSAGGP